MLFCRFGYYGATTRDIAKKAGVGLGVSTYHFASKEDLFRAVIARRADEHLDRLTAALDQTIAAAGDNPPTVEALIRSFLEPIAERSLFGGAGWKNYVQLLSQSMNTRQVEGFLTPVVEIYHPLLSRFILEFKRAIPAGSDKDINLAFYFLQAALIHILIETGTLDRQSKGLCRADDLRTIVDSMVPFFAAGFHRMVEHGSDAHNQNASKSAIPRDQNR